MATTAARLFSRCPGRARCCSAALLLRPPPPPPPAARAAARFSGLRPRASPPPPPPPPPLPRRRQRENIYTLPNILTFSRLLAAPVVGYLVVHDCHAWAAGLFVYAGVTDLVDGYVARRWNLRTVVGTVLDPMADKTLMTVLTVCFAVKGALPGTSSSHFAILPLTIHSPPLGVPPHTNTGRKKTPVWLAAIILGRDVGLGIAAVYYRWISLPPPKTFSRYWDFSLPSAEVRPTTISKYNTALQLALMGATTVIPLLTIDVSVAMSAMQ